MLTPVTTNTYPRAPAGPPPGRAATSAAGRLLLNTKAGAGAGVAGTVCGAAGVEICGDGVVVCTEGVAEVTGTAVAGVSVDWPVGRVDVGEGLAVGRNGTLLAAAVCADVGATVAGTTPAADGSTTLPPHAMARRTQIQACKPMTRIAETSGDPDRSPAHTSTGDIETARSTSVPPGELFAKYGAKMYLDQVLAKKQVLRA